MKQLNEEVRYRLEKRRSKRRNSWLNWLIKLLLLATIVWVGWSWSHKQPAAKPAALTQTLQGD